MTAWLPPEVWDALERTTPEEDAAEAARAKALKRRPVSDAEYEHRYALEHSAYIARYSWIDHEESPGENCLSTGQWLTAKPSTGDTRWRVWMHYGQMYPGLHVVDADGSKREWDWRELFK